MLHTCHDLLLGSCIAGQFVGNDHAWHILASFEQFFEKDFIQMPLAPWPSTLALELIGVLLSKFQPPFGNGFVGEARHHALLEALQYREKLKKKRKYNQTA